jgi:tetratricopeptide (TPR) repeat protein
MKVLIPIVIGLLVVGCGKKAATDSVIREVHQKTQLTEEDIKNMPDESVRALALEGNLDAQYRLGVRHYLRSKHDGYTLTLVWWTIAAANGHEKANDNFGSRRYAIERSNPKSIAEQEVDADALIKQLVTENPKLLNADGMNEIGYEWLERKINFQEAKALIGKAMQLKPEDSYILDSMALVAIREENFKKALDLQLKALKFAKREDSLIYMQLGEIYHGLNDNMMARKFLDKALGAKNIDEPAKK